MDCYKLNILCKDENEYNLVQSALFTFGYSWSLPGPKFLFYFPVIILCDNIRSKGLQYDNNGYNINNYKYYDAGDVILAASFLRRYKLYRLNSLSCL